MQEVILVGGFHEIIELCEGTNVGLVGIFDNVLEGDFMGYPVLGNDQNAIKQFSTYRKYPIIITPDKPAIRQKLVTYYANSGYDFFSLVSRNAIISKSASLGKGVVIQDLCNVSAGASIGDFVKVNTGANIMHDAVIGEFSTIAPNAVILGRVVIGRNCYIGANATILPGITIGDNATVGAGAVVTKNVDKETVVTGIPAKKRN